MIFWLSIEPVFFATSLRAADRRPTPRPSCCRCRTRCRRSFLTYCATKSLVAARLRDRRPVAAAEDPVDVLLRRPCSGTPSASWRRWRRTGTSGCSFGLDERLHLARRRPPTACRRRSCPASARSPSRRSASGRSSRPGRSSCRRSSRPAFSKLLLHRVGDRRRERVVERRRTTPSSAAATSAASSGSATNESPHLTTGAGCTKNRLCSLSAKTFGPPPAGSRNA